MKVLPLILLFLFTFNLHAADHPELNAYPPAKDGRIRHVISLPAMADEDTCKVEIFVGKTIITDAANAKGMNGIFAHKTLEGWGYPYYEAETGPIISTLMMPPPGQENVERFVSLPGEMIRYNSKLPIVIYTNPDAEVRYRIWTAGKMRSPSEGPRQSPGDE